MEEQVHILNDYFRSNNEGALKKPVDEQGNRTTLSHGLYESFDQPLGDDDNTKMLLGHMYQAEIPRPNVIPTGIVWDFRASKSGGAATTLQLCINDNLELQETSVGATLSNYHVEKKLSTSEQKELWQHYRDDMTGWCYELVNVSYLGESIDIHGSELRFLGDSTYNNFDADVTGDDLKRYVPSGISMNPSSSTYPNTWTSESGHLAGPKDAWRIQIPPTGIGVDTNYLQNDYRARSDGLIHNHNGYSQLADQYPSGIHLKFMAHDLEATQRISRAQLDLRLSFPHSGTYDNAKTGLTILGRCNHVHSGRPLVHGYGGLVWATGWQTYTTELSFLSEKEFTAANPERLFNKFHNHAETFRNINFDVTGIPSGARFSGAELRIYCPQDNAIGLTTLGGNLYNSSDSLATDNGIKGARYEDWQSNRKLGCFTHYFNMSEYEGSGTYDLIGSASGVLKSYNSGGETIVNGIWWNRLRDGALPHAGPQSTQFNRGFRDAVLLGPSGAFHFGEETNVVDDFTVYMVVARSGAHYNKYNGELFSRANSIGEQEFELYFSDNYLTLEYWDDIGGSDTIEQLLTSNETDRPLHIAVSHTSEFNGASPSGQFILWRGDDRALELAVRSPYVTRQKVLNAETFVGHAPHKTSSACFNGWISEFGVASGAALTNSDWQGTNFPFYERSYKHYVPIDEGLPAGSGDKIGVKIPAGSGGISMSTSETLFMSYNNPSIMHSLHGPARLGYNKIDVAPSSIRVDVVMSHNTNHPSGANFKARLSLDSGFSTDYRTFRKDFILGSSNTVTKTLYPDLEFSKLNESVVFSDVTDIDFTLDYEYHDHPDWYADIEVESVNVLFNGWSIAQTGTNNFPLFINGDYESINKSVDLMVYSNYATGETDLFVHGHEDISKSATLFTLSGATTNALDLFIQGHIPNSGFFPLYTANATPINSGWPLYIDGIFRENASMPMYTKSHIPVSSTQSAPLYTWSTTNSGVRNTLPMMLYSNVDPDNNLNLYLKGLTQGTSTGNMPLYLHNDNSASHILPLTLWNTISGVNNSMTLYLSTASSIRATANIPLFISRNEENTADRIPLYISGPTAFSGIFPMYVKGASGAFDNLPLSIPQVTAPINKGLPFYTTGF